MENSIEKTNMTDGTILYTIRGPLNKTLKSKLKNKSSSILNNANTVRNLSNLRITPNDSEETQTYFELARLVKPDLKGPVIQVASLYNRLSINILSNSKRGTYIKKENRTRHFKPMGKSIKVGEVTGHFLRKGIGAKLLHHVIDEHRTLGIKTVLVHPSNRALEQYYGRFGFKPLDNVPYNISMPGLVFESHGQGRLMYLEID